MTNHTFELALDGDLAAEDAEQLRTMLERAAFETRGQHRQQSMDTVAAALPAANLYLTAALTALPAVTGVLGAWIQARFGRKVRIKLGDIEVEATSVAEVKTLLESSGAIAMKLRGDRNEKETALDDAVALSSGTLEALKKAVRLVEELNSIATQRQRAVNPMFEPTREFRYMLDQYVNTLYNIRERIDQRL